MVRTRRIAHILAAAALAAITARNAAHAGITVTTTFVQLGGIANANTLDNNGWVGIKVTAVADAASGTVAGFDLESSDGGIYDAAIHQTAKLTDPGLTGVWTTATPTLQATVPAFSSSTLVDSFFDAFTGKGFSATASLSEDSNHQSTLTTPPFTGPNPPYNHSPLSEAVNLPDGSGFAILGQGPGDNGDGSGSGPGGAYQATNFGVGTSLHGAGIFTSNQSAAQAIAYVVIPSFSIYFDGIRQPEQTFFIRGDFTDAHGATFHVDTSPEPASLSILALGALALFARRRGN